MNNTFSHSKDHPSHMEQLWDIFLKNVLDKVLGWFRLKRLRDLLFRGFLLGVVFFIIYSKMVSYPYLSLDSFVVGTPIGLAFGFLMVFYYKNRIKGNSFVLKPFSGIKEVTYGFMAGVFFLILDSWFNFSDKVWWARYIVSPGCFAFPVALGVTLIWLIQYEKIHGIVYMKYSTLG